MQVDVFPTFTPICKWDVRDHGGKTAIVPMRKNNGRFEECLVTQGVFLQLKCPDNEGSDSDGS